MKRIETRRERGKRPVSSMWTPPIPGFLSNIFLSFFFNILVENQMNDNFFFIKFYEIIFMMNRLFLYNFIKKFNLKVNKIII